MNSVVSRVNRGRTVHVENLLVGQSRTLWFVTLINITRPSNNGLKLKFP